MSNEKASDQDSAKKIAAMNDIFEGLIADASELIEDLYWGVKTYLFYGLIMILFGISEIAYNANAIQERLYIPLFIAGALLFAGAAQILNYLRLRSKYAKLFKIKNELKKA
jgi:uncharacterized membrane protein HdeD (DUF308 family)